MNKYWWNFIGSGKPQNLGEASPRTTLYTVYRTWTDLERGHALTTPKVCCSHKKFLSGLSLRKM